MTPPPTTLARFVRDALGRHAEHVFLVNPDGASWTYGEAARTIDRLHGVLRAAGLRPGDRVALLGSNSAQWAIVYLALVTAGHVAVPILPDFPAASVHNILAMSTARAAFASAALLDRLRGASLPDLRHAFQLETFEEAPLPGRDLLAPLRDRVERLAEQAQNLLPGHPPEPSEHQPAPDDLAAIVYTSGTTGSSKGVMLTQANLVSDVLSAIRYVEVSPSDRLLSLLPLAHTYECTCGFLGPLGGGAAFYHLEAKPAPRVLVAAFARVKPTLVFAVPLVIEKIYRSKVRPAIDGNRALRILTRLPSFRRAAYRRAVRGLMQAFGGELRQMGFGGAALSREVERFLREGGFPYFVGYGMTECSPLITGCRPEETRPGSCGYPVEHLELRIAEPDATGIGEVQVRGPMVTSGYYRNPEATAALFTADGWLRTGDLGRLDRDRFLYLKGRSKNVFLGPSGENIYPEEIEQLLMRSPLVAEALVVQRERRLVALIVADYDAVREQVGANVDEGEVSRRVHAAFTALLDGANAELPAFSRLAAFELRESEFEKTPTAKVKRYLYA